MGQYKKALGSALVGTFNQVKFEGEKKMGSGEAKKLAKKRMKGGFSSALKTFGKREAVGVMDEAPDILFA